MYEVYERSVCSLCSCTVCCGSTLTNMQRGDSLKENHKAVGAEGHTQVQMLPHSCTAGYSEAATSVACVKRLS